MLLLLFACHVTKQTCEVERIDVGDAEQPGDLGVSASDVLAVVAITYDLPAALGGAPTRFEYVGVRGEGSAVFLDTSVVVTERALGLAMEGLSLECADQLLVPVDAAVATSDGTLAASGTIGVATERFSDGVYSAIITVVDESGALADEAEGGSDLYIGFSEVTLYRAFSCDLEGVQFEAPPGAAACG